MESTIPSGSASANTSSTAPQPHQSQNSRHNRFPGRRKPRLQHETANSDSQIASDGPDAQTSASNIQQQRRRRPPKPRKPITDGQPGRVPINDSTAEPSSASGTNSNRRRRPPRPHSVPVSGVNDQTASDRAQTSTHSGQPNEKKGRRGKFQGKLTENDNSSKTPLPSHPSRKYHSKVENSAADDLTSRLIRELSFPPYPDCPICFSSVHREQPIWSCSPSIATILPHDVEGPPQYCWTTFHLKCIRSWASKSVKDIEDAWRARGEGGRTGDWRCPGCQAKREVVPKVYW